MIEKTLEELKVIISAETSKFSNALKNATNEAKTSASSIESSTGRISRAVSGIKSMVAKVAAGFGLYKLGKEAIEVASNITEVQNVVDTAFGDMAWKAERFAKNSIQQFGMSELSAKNPATIPAINERMIGLFCLSQSLIEFNFLSTLSTALSTPLVSGSPKALSQSIEPIS